MYVPYERVISSPSPHQTRRLASDELFRDADMRRRHQRGALSDMADGQRLATTRDVNREPQQAFHDIFRHRMASLLDFSALPFQSRDADDDGAPALPHTHRRREYQNVDRHDPQLDDSSPFTSHTRQHRYHEDVPPSVRNTLELLDRLEETLMASPVRNMEESKCMLVDTSTQTLPESRDKEELRAASTTTGDKQSVDRWIALQEEARRRREWYENYVGWMMYYRHLENSDTEARSKRLQEHEM
mmetsp:Transcript_40566/g.47177  ORF Transcript_40566/g.47177 Transcript_40566/m.47177 type:complete len:244 (-) Transcript_40566:6-737(-)